MNRLSRFKIAAVVAVGIVCLIVLVIGGVVWYGFFGPGYYLELNSIRHELRRIPGVTIVELDGNRDLSLEDIRARVHIENKGDMEFFDLRPDSFQTASHLRLRSVGPYSIRVGGEGYVGAFETASGKPVRSEFHGGSADIGPGGEFAKMFPFEVSNVQTAIGRYDDIYRVVAGWPRESSRGHIRDAKGTDFYYYVETIGIQQAALSTEASPHP